MRLISIAIIGSALVACASPNPAPEPGAADGGQQVTQPVVPLACTPAEGMALEGRPSPYDSATIAVGANTARICYGRPYAKGREIFGGLVAWGQLWRTGANEPTTLHLPLAANVAGLQLPAGSYSLYTVPQPSGDWDLVVNRSTSQWGHESSYTAEIQAQEVGRRPIRTERLDQHVEQFTIRSEPSGGGADILLEWERTRARIPIRAVGG